MKSVRRTRYLVLGSAVAVVIAGGCTGEDATPIDLSPSTSVTGVPATASHASIDPEDDVNAESRQMAIDFAEQQCFDDPEAEEGIIRIVDPSTDQVVGEVVVDCDEVRARPVDE